MKPLIMAWMFFLLCSTAVAEENSSLIRGKELFETTSLGTSGKSCSTCHPHGKGLEEIGAYDDPMLEEMINFCIRDALEGAMLEPTSPRLKAFRLYLRSLPGD